MSEITEVKATVNTEATDSAPAQHEQKPQNSKRYLRKAADCLRRESVSRTLYRVLAGHWLSLFYQARQANGIKRKDTSREAKAALALYTDGGAGADYDPDTLMGAYQVVALLGGHNDVASKEARAAWSQTSWGNLIELRSLLVRPNETEDWSVKPQVDMDGARHLFARCLLTDKEQRIGRETLREEILRLVDKDKYDALKATQNQERTEANEEQASAEQEQDKPATVQAGKGDEDMPAAPAPKDEPDGEMDDEPEEREEEEGTEERRSNGKGPVNWLDYCRKTAAKATVRDYADFIASAMMEHGAAEDVLLEVVRLFAYQESGCESSEAFSASAGAFLDAYTEEQAREPAAV